MRRTHVGGDDVAGVFFRLAVLLIDAERARQIGIEFAGRHRRFADVTLLRWFAKSPRHRSARPVGVGEIGAAVEGIIRWRLQPRRSLLPSPLRGGVGGGGREVLRVR